MYHKKLRWKNLRFGNCPVCNEQLRKIDGMDIYKCLETCGFKIGERALKNILGYEKKQGAATWYVDGFLKGSMNPSPYGGGYVVADSAGAEVKRIEVIEKDFTNNKAELLAIIAGMELCASGDEICTDSRNTEIWIKSGKSKARPDLVPMIKYANELMHAKEVCITWVPREQNLAGIIIEVFQESRRNSFARRV